jgi:hypothetical protein
MPDIAGPGHEWQEEDGVTVLASDLTVTSVRTVCSYCGSAAAWSSTSPQTPPVRGGS